MQQISDRDIFFFTKSMNIALSNQTDDTLQAAAEAVASAILNGVSGKSLRSESIAILINENLQNAIPYVDEILNHRLNSRC